MTRPWLELHAFAVLTLLACTLAAPAAWPAAAKPPAEQAPLETLLVAAESTPTERLLDGTVEAVFAGPADAVAGIVEACRRGPWGARVDGIDEREATQQQLALRKPGEDFSVLPTV